MNTDQTLNITTICRYLTRGTSIFLFLVLSFLLAVVLVVFLQPIGLLVNTTQTTTLSPLAQVACIALSGYIAVVLSRLVLYWIGRQKLLPPLVCGIWMVIELLLCVTAAVLTAWLISGGGPLRVGPLTGDMLLGNIGVFLFPNIIAFQEFRIHEFKVQLRQLMAPTPTLKTVPSMLPDHHINFYDKGGRLALTTRCSNVLYIEAADNYANIHYINDGKEDTFILHNSLKDIEKDYLPEGLLRCHRGYMVNVDNVKLMRRDKSSFVLEMNKTVRTIPVSKSYADQVTRYFSGNM